VISLAWLIPIALGMGGVGLMAFLWSVRSNQYEDLDGAAERVLLDQGDDRPTLDHPECCDNKWRS